MKKFKIKKLKRNSLKDPPPPKRDAQREREREREMGDEIDIREDIAQLIRDVAAPRDAAIARLRAKIAAIKEENAQLLALTSRLSSVEMAGESSESGERNICPIARSEGAGAKRARDEDTPVCVVLCGEEDCGALVELPCGHHRGP